MNIIWELEHETFFNRTTYSCFTKITLFFCSIRRLVAGKIVGWCLPFYICIYLWFAILFTSSHCFCSLLSSLLMLQLRVCSHVYVFVFVRVKVAEYEYKLEKIEVLVFFVNKMLSRFFVVVVNRHVVHKLCLELDKIPSKVHKRGKKNSYEQDINAMKQWTSHAQCNFLKCHSYWISWM